MMTHAQSRRSRRKGWVLAGALLIGTLLPYAQVAGHAFLFFDDDRYVTDNPVVRSGLSCGGIAWAFTTLEVSNWHPLTWLAHMLDVQLFGLDAGSHHLVNAGFHALNAALLFLALLAMTAAARRSAFVAALFAVHPLHVESVAWISERKDVLSTFFGLLMLLAYVRHARRPGLGRYALIVLSLAASLLAKPMWVTAPFLLLLLDAWPLRRITGLALDQDPATPTFPPRKLRSILAEKLPLLALSIASSAMTVIAQQHGGSIQTLENLDFAERASNAVVSYARYLGKTFWPSGLSAFYPLPREDAEVWPVAAASVLLLVLTALVVARARRAPWLAVGWFWFFGTLVPVIGLVQVGDQAMADRYTYLPIIGVFVALTWEVGALLERTRSCRLAVGIAAVVVGVLALATWRQTSYWRDQETLFRHAVAVAPDNGRAHLILCQALGQQGRYADAALEAGEATRLDPDNPRAHKNLGFMLYRLGRLDEAIAALRHAIDLQPDYAEAHGILAIAYGKKGRMAEAMQEMSLEMKLRSEQQPH
jgi:hypothetical protein